MNQFGQYQQPYPATSSAGGAPPGAGGPIVAPTCRDVLNGRGQGVQRHPGNVKYRTLVFVNKGLYAKCPRADKMKISKGIVAAVRELGGRFLELNERTGVYQDIGDKKATEKTSQALREGQTKIRKQMYKEEENKTSNGQPKSAFDTSLLSGPGNVPMPTNREISAEGYFGYSVQVLESLYNADEPAAAATAAAGGPVVSPVPSANPDMMNATPAALAMALDQFPGAAAPAVKVEQQQMPPPLSVPPADIGRFTNSSVRITEAGRPSLGRFTNMSLGSMFSLTSVRQLLESARNENYTAYPAEGDRGSIRSVLSSEIRDLIRLSEPQLMQVENMTMDDVNNGVVPPPATRGSSSSASHEDKEVVLPDADAMEDDRVSELRFTDVSRPSTWGKSAGGGGNPRLTESTEATDYSKTSLMDASMMTIDSDDMSVHSSKEEKTASPKKTDEGGKDSGGNNSGDLATAELLLRFSGENSGVGRQAEV